MSEPELSASPAPSSTSAFLLGAAATAAGMVGAKTLWNAWKKSTPDRTNNDSVCPFAGARGSSNTSGYEHRINVKEPSKNVAVCPFTGATAPSSTSSQTSHSQTSAGTTKSLPAELKTDGCALKSVANPLSPSKSRPRRSFDHPVHYHTYLGLDQLLSAQKPLSAASGHMAHDELLFIITHQSHELWFKQISHDLESVIAIMGEDVIPERDLAKVIERLTRISKILALLVQHLPILETMTPLSFLDFRDYLYPASGFQSMQFRTLEVRLGLRRANRLEYSGQGFECALTPQQREAITALGSHASLFDNVDKWLSRLPVLRVADFDFWKAYQSAVTSMLDQEEKDLDQYAANHGMDEKKIEGRRREIKQQRDYFSMFWTKETYEQSIEAGARRLSFKACQAALMINFYQEEPLFQVPFQLLTLLLEIDATLTQWRTKHAQMVHRMLGLKMGTGGSSGHHYLQATVTKHKIFSEFFNLASFMVPRFYLPPLPPSVSSLTGFHNFQDGCSTHAPLPSPAPPVDSLTLSNSNLEPLPISTVPTSTSPAPTSSS